MKQILIVEDDNLLNKTLAYNLASDDYAITNVLNARAAAEALKAKSFDLVLLDINLPDGNGYDLCRLIKPEHPDTVVIFLTANDQECDQIWGYEVGAMDYITKPFSLSVLRARVNTQLRKAESLQAHTSASVYRKGCYEFDFERMIFLVDGQEIELSKTEQRLLRLLVQNEGINLRRDFLLDRVWNDSAEFVDANALSVSVKRLRDKLGTPDSIKIKTVYGIGYRFE